MLQHEIGPLPASLTATRVAELATEVEAIQLADLSRWLQDPDTSEPLDLLRHLARLLDQSEKVNTLLRTATLNYAAVRDRRQRAESLRRRLIERAISDGEVDTGGTAAERQIFVESEVERRRREETGNEDLPTLQETIADLKCLELRWNALAKSVDSQRKLIKQADQLGRLAQKILAGVESPGRSRAKRPLPEVEDEETDAAAPGP